MGTANVRHSQSKRARGKLRAILNANKRAAAAETAALAKKTRFQLSMLRAQQAHLRCSRPLCCRPPPPSQDAAGCPCPECYCRWPACCPPWCCCCCEVCPVCCQIRVQLQAEHHG